MSNKVLSSKDLANFIDHTILKPETSRQDIVRICTEAIDYGFHTVCLNPRWIGFAADLLAGKSPKVCSVIGFPLGAELTEVKKFQTKRAILAGADEIDMVADIAAIQELNDRAVVNDIYPVLKVCKSYRPGVILKVIIESALLTNEQIIFVCKICSRIGVDFVKTSTGLHPAGGASVAAVKLMKESAPNCKNKAAGGIRTAQQAIEFIEAGAERIGCSASVDIIKQFELIKTT